MEIIDNRKKSIEFENVKYGEVFGYNGNFFMKINETYCDECGDYDNSVNIENGELNYFKDDIFVMPVKCKLVIE